MQLIRSSVDRRPALGDRFWLPENRTTFGEYRFGRLPEWHAHISLRSRAGHWLHATRERRRFGAPRLPLHTLRCCYPNTPDASRAAPVALRTGREGRAEFAACSTLNGTIRVLHHAPPGIGATFALTYDGVASRTATEQARQVFRLSIGLRPQGGKAGTSRRRLEPCGASLLGQLIRSACSAPPTVNAFGASATIDVAGADVMVGSRPGTDGEGP